MQINGKWIGWGPGTDDIPPDKDPYVAVMKAKLKAKYTWVRNHQPPMDDSDVYTATMAEIVAEWQGRVGLPITGIMNARSQERLGTWTPPKPKLPVAMSVQGTAQPDPMGPGLPADICRYLESIGKCRWQGIGNYPATAFPMWPSIMLGVAELAVQVERFAFDDIWLTGYSQGAVVVCYYWKHYVQDPQGPHHHRFFDPDHPKDGTIKKIVVMGNPMREEGFAHFDGLFSPVTSKGAGILEDRMVDSPPYMRDYAHEKDMYAQCPFSDMGEDERAICKIIMGNKVFSGTDSILAQVIELIQRPITETIAMFYAMIDAGMFLASGANTPHFYDIRPMVDFLAA